MDFVGNLFDYNEKLPKYALNIRDAAHKTRVFNRSSNPHRDAVFLTEGGRLALKNSLYIPKTHKLYTTFKQSKVKMVSKPTKNSVFLDNDKWSRNFIGYRNNGDLVTIEKGELTRNAGKPGELSGITDVIATVPHSFKEPKGTERHFHSHDHIAVEAAQRVLKGLSKSDMNVTYLESGVNRMDADMNRNQYKKRYWMQYKLNKTLQKIPRNSSIHLDLHSYYNPLPHPFEHWKNFHLTLMSETEDYDLCNRIAKNLMAIVKGSKVQVTDAHPISRLQKISQNMKIPGIVFEFNRDHTREIVLELASALPTVISRL